MIAWSLFKMPFTIWRSEYFGVCVMGMFFIEAYKKSADLRCLFINRGLRIALTLQQTTGNLRWYENILHHTHVQHGYNHTHRHLLITLIWSVNEKLRSFLLIKRKASINAISICKKPTPKCVCKTLFTKHIALQHRIRPQRYEKFSDCANKKDEMAEFWQSFYTFSVRRKRKWQRKYQKDARMGCGR